MKYTVAIITLIASASLIGGCDNIVPSAESVLHKPTIQVATELASGDRWVCVGTMANGPCTAKSAQAVISGATKANDVSAHWEGEGKVIVRIGSGNLEKSSGTAMDGHVTIEYREGNSPPTRSR
jgi:hypothetical protein